MQTPSTLAGKSAPREREFPGGQGWTDLLTSLQERHRKLGFSRSFHPGRHKCKGLEGCVPWAFLLLDWYPGPDSSAAWVKASPSWDTLTHLPRTHGQGLTLQLSTDTQFTHILTPTFHLRGTKQRGCLQTWVQSRV